MQPDEKLRSEAGRPLDDIHGQLVTCRVEELHPHPSYVRHQPTVSASQLSALADLGDLAFRDPLVITGDGTILDGYARWELARLQGRSTLVCIEYELTEAEALQFLLQRHRRSNGLNDFMRILLALDLEPWFKEKGRTNQRAGGQNRKGSSNLTEAERLDVRAEIACAAGVSAGSLTKVKQLIKTAHPKLQQALRAGGISIHKAWLWSKLSAEKQLTELHLHESQRGTKKTIRLLLRQHVAKSSPVSANPRSLGDLLRSPFALQSKELDSIAVAEINVPRKYVFLTREALQALKSIKR